MQDCDKTNGEKHNLRKIISFPCLKYVFTQMICTISVNNPESIRYNIKQLKVKIKSIP